MTFSHPLSISFLQPVPHPFGILMQMLGHKKESRGHIPLCKSTSYLEVSSLKKRVTIYLNE